jgi:putative mRNA 3-end processing factor
MRLNTDLIVQRPEGLYCPPGDFYIDPWRPVARAVITHAHADHARRGHGHYLAVRSAEGLLRARLGAISLMGLDYGQRIVHNGVGLSLHPAGHVLGSAQVRLEYGGQVWVASGDYKVAADRTCTPFEPVRCDVFITESTFGLPIYRWADDEQVFAAINRWWAANAAQDCVSVLMGYSLGKAQRLLSGLDEQIAPILVHPSIEALNAIYRAAGVSLPATEPLSRWTSAAQARREGWAGALVLVPPQAVTPALLRRLGSASTAFASGWMQLRGARRRAGWDTGFALSDHADWPGLQSAIAATGAQRVIVTHGSVSVMVRYLQEQGLQAEAFETEYGAAHEGNEGHDGHDGQGSVERQADPELHQTQPQAGDSPP